MTDEQIKQNAEEYASTKEMHSPRSQDVELDKLMIIEDYIAGAHSRDEEIKELEKKVSALETVIVTARADISTQEAIIKDLRNKWRDTSKELPKSEDEIFIYVGGVPMIGRYIPDKNIWIVPGFGILDDADYWMSIPELK